MIDQTNIIRNEINSFGFTHQFTEETGAMQYSGASAFEVLVHRLPDLISYSDKEQADPFKYISQLKSLELLLISISNCIDFVRNSKADEDDKIYLVSDISYQYNSKIRVAFDSTLERFKTGYTFNFPSNANSQSVFTDRLFDIVKEIDLKLS